MLCALVLTFSLWDVSSAKVWVNIFTQYYQVVQKEKNKLVQMNKMFLNCEHINFAWCESMCTCMHVCCVWCGVCVWCVCVFVKMWKRVCACVRASVRVCAMCVCVVRVWWLPPQQMWPSHTHTHTCFHIFTHTHKHTHTHTHTHACTNTHARTRAHTHRKRE